ncbi:pyruvate formate lyase family protein [Chloroflexota bacterium]
MAVDKGLLEQIDKIQLSEWFSREREEFFKREMEITADRAILAMESWQETEGDVLDIRWAKLAQKWAERLPIVIFKGQLVVGSETKLFRGADPWVEVEAPNVLETMEEERREIRTSAVRVSKCTDEVWEAIGEAVNFFLGETPVDLIYKNMRLLYGDWPEEFEKVGGTRRQGRFNMTSPIPMWEKLLDKGLRGIIQEAEAGIEKVRSGEEPDAKKAWFWQATIIVCEAVIHYAHRYSRLARELAQGEHDPARRRELEQAAEACERVPEYPARTLQEAVQSRVMWGLAIKWCRADLVEESGRLDQYLYPYLISDIREHRLTLEEASDLIGSLLSNLSRRDGVKNVLRGQAGQGTLVNNVTLGGVTKDEQDANNELTYLILHMVGLLKYAEPHYTFRVNAGTPKWVMLKAMDTNLKVGGGQPPVYV